MLAAYLSTIAAIRTDLGGHPGPALDAFRRVTQVCSTCIPPGPTQGLRVVNAASGGCHANASLATCADACMAQGKQCIAFGFLASRSACELYMFTQRYTVVVDPEPWQYWLQRDAPGLAPTSMPAARVVRTHLGAPTKGVILTDGSVFARSMAISVDYLLRNYHVDDMLWWFRHRAALPQPNASAAPRGWDRCVNNLRGGVGHLCLKGGAASTFLMGAGGHLRWMSPATSSAAAHELRRRFDAVLSGIDAAASPSGFAAAFAENETMYRENPDYVLAWLTHGLLESSVAESDTRGVAMRLARGMIDWFSSLEANWLLPEFMPPDRTTADVPRVIGAQQGHQIYLIYQGIIHHSRLATSALGRQRDVDVIVRRLATLRSSTRPPHTSTAHVHRTRPPHTFTAHVHRTRSPHTFTAHVHRAPSCARTPCAGPPTLASCVRLAPTGTHVPGGRVAHSAS